MTTSAEPTALVVPADPAEQTSLVVLDPGTPVAGAAQVLGVAASELRVVELYSGAVVYFTSAASARGSRHNPRVAAFVAHVVDEAVHGDAVILIPPR